MSILSSNRCLVGNGEESDGCVALDFASLPTDLGPKRYISQYKWRQLNLLKFIQFINSVSNM